MNTDAFYISRCLQIAKQGLGTTSPNPMVGCVIVNNGIIISEGFTSPYGGNHAEVNAIQAISDKYLLHTSTLYVTLEPCSHYGKTPPCVNLILEYHIPRVVIGCIDTHSAVNGQGIQKLRDSGCHVTVGVLEALCKQHHKRFFTYHNKKRPYIILKWAETKDGFIAPDSKLKKAPVWITNNMSRLLVHKWRSEEQAILVGRKTVSEDNPKLTVRDWHGNHPVRVVIDRKNTLSEDFFIFDNSSKTIVISENNADFSKPIAQQICDILYGNSINSIIIEGGAKTLQTFINEGLWDEARIFVSQDTIFESGIRAPKISGKINSEIQLQMDLLKILKPS